MYMYVYMQTLGRCLSLSKVAVIVALGGYILWERSSCAGFVRLGRGRKQRGKSRVDITMCKSRSIAENCEKELTMNRAG